MSFRTVLQHQSDIQLDQSARSAHASPTLWSRVRSIMTPLADTTFGVVGFLTCGAAVVVTATLVALQIH